ncbi:hypothetical protein PR048_002329 [Dryococelus australis]|uniref:Uncharacterized protein n=1 Tax=Dryococelus australis TaxID=614101 RepID=A0ABQ9IJW2_9NEOP|nr:hypothetical protein PR048_002329 [Dryococelus australis]
MEYVFFWLCMELQFLKFPLQQSILDLRSIDKTQYISHISITPTHSYSCSTTPAQTWLGSELNPEHWGWVVKNNLLEPIMTLLPPAPDVLLKAIFCNCTKGWGTNYGCRKDGLPCSIEEGVNEEYEEKEVSKVEDDEEKEVPEVEDDDEKES